MFHYSQTLFPTFIQIVKFRLKVIYYNLPTGITAHTAEENNRLFNIFLYLKKIILKEWKCSLLSLKIVGNLFV